MITPHPLLRVIISVLVLSNEYVSVLSPGGENPCLIISTSTLQAMVDSTEYHFISNLKDRQIKVKIRLLVTPQSPQNTEQSTKLNFV